MTTPSHSKQIENHLDEQKAKWFAVYTKYKREKIIKEMLIRKDIEVYVPIQKVTRRYTRKVKHLELPLISCYIFVKIVKKDYVRVLETENVVKFVRFSKNLLSIPEREIEVLKRVVGEGLPIEAEPLAFVQGDEVEIITGNLTGLKGKLVERQGSHQVLVELNQVGFALRVTIPLEYLQKVK